MAFNPQAYETIYGFSFLDEIHNFFPELLYDDTLFGAESMRWIRHRVNVLFPQVYVRQRNLYNIYSAHTRLRSYVQWQLDTNTAPRPAATPIQTPEPFVMLSTPPPPRAASAPQTVDISGAPVPGAAAPRTRVRTTTTTTTTAQIPTLLTSLLWEIREPGAQDVPGDTILDMLNFAFQDVIVAPTLEQINAASRLRNNHDVPSETDCSICQEHTNPDSVWRELGCGHMYHRACIDTWLGSHSQCPICRRDIRTLERPEALS